MSDKETGPLSERKVVRRGLLAGLAAFGAALAMKVTSTETARANDNDFLQIGNESQTAQTKTSLSGTMADGPMVELLANAAGASTATDATLRVGNKGTSVSAINAAVTAPSGSPSMVNARTIIGSTVFDGVGVEGVTSSGIGVRGIASDPAGTGVRGAGDGNGTGVKGVSNTGNDFNADGTGSGVGVQGKSASGTGVRGDSTSGPGVHGQSTSSLGVRGVSTSFVGVVGISTQSHGLYGSSGHVGSAGLVGENTAGGPAGIFNGNVQIYGALQVFGAKSAVIKMSDGSNAAVYCQESPEPYFEDFGEARLVNGVAQVALEPEFATLVSGGKYMVFPAPQGDTKGLYVSRQDAHGFEVREVQGGTGNVPFTYRIVTKRKDIEGKRFARVSDDGRRSAAAVRDQVIPRGNANGAIGP